MREFAPTYNPDVSPLVESKLVRAALPDGVPCAHLFGKKAEKQDIASEFCQNVLMASGLKYNELVCSAFVSCKGRILNIKPTIVIPVEGDEPTAEAEAVELRIRLLLNDSDILSSILSNTIPGSHVIPA